MTTEELIKKYNVQPEDAKELRDFSEFLRVRKNAKVEKAFADCSALTWHPVYRRGAGTVWKVPATPQTRDRYLWTIQGNNGRMHSSSWWLDGELIATAQLNQMLEALEL